MTRITTTRIAAGIALFALGTSAMAQYTGPGSREPARIPVLRTVAQVLQKPIDDQHVELTGRLVRQSGHETFLFRDATGEIQVEIDRDDFPAGIGVGPDTLVALRGEVERRLLRAPEIDVEVLTVLPPAARPADAAAPTTG